MSAHKPPRRVGDAAPGWRPLPSAGRPLRGRTALVAGASRGIGAMLAEVLLLDGAHVAIAGRDADALTARRTQLRDAMPDGDVSVHPCDITDADAVGALVDDVTKQNGVLDILVPAAGVTGPVETPITEVTAEEFREVLDVNLTGTFLCCRAAVPALSRAEAGGRIVTFSSTAGLRGYANRVAYSASKWGIRGLTRALARELGPFGITVNSVSPYTVHGTRMADVVAAKAQRLGIEPEDVYEDFTKQTALGRWVDEGDVAETIRFLVSDAARNITGQDIAIDAGWDA